MFAGIVEGVAVITELKGSASLLTMTIQSPVATSEIKLGDSVCLDGVCLTVVKNIEPHLTFEIAPETLRKTTLQEKRVGEKVNFERSLALGDRIHGHFVWGHVDETAKILKLSEDGDALKLEIELSPTLAPFVAPKGSISVSGVSLTVGEVSHRSFFLYIIPHTASVTSLGELIDGAKVNLEVDMLSRYVVNALAVRRG